MGAALIPHSILGLMSQYLEVQEEFNKQIKTEGLRNATGFLAAKELAFKQSVFVYIFQNIFDFFKDGKAVLQIPSVAKDPCRKRDGKPWCTSDAFAGVQGNKG
jgi:hypothetical protein